MSDCQICADHVRRYQMTDRQTARYLDGCPGRRGHDAEAAEDAAVDRADTGDYPDDDDRQAVMGVEGWR